ncbi:DUF5675 family protein [Abyssalbus ytuae]|uniref:DUF5675 family protein n=1 Tax=Abyssalbus ytuae TaxID=2926907 RepID=A0A9E6ZL43_9FLAO|nr:DUF5675 family protein [Abyssalbus ytuae]UOB16594.1 DUF5675 family protein [Abyssalbus ytuae]
MKTVVIARDDINNTHSLGICHIYDEENKLVFVSHSLERGWRDNKNKVSCIPAGNYDLKVEYSPKFGRELWEIYGVKNRRECKFHAANYWFQLNGCIALGKARADINGDGELDIIDSIKTMDEFHNIMAGDKQAKLIVLNIDVLLNR